MTSPSSPARGLDTDLVQATSAPTEPQCDQLHAVLTVIKVSHFTDQRIASVYDGSEPLTLAERQFLIEDTPTFEECGESNAALNSMTDADLMQTAYGVWADYASGL